MNQTQTRTIRLDTTNPNITLVSPTNNTYTNNPNVNFTINGTDNLGIKNLSLNVRNSSGFVNTTDFTNTNGNILTDLRSFVLNLIDGVYTWWANIFDWAGNSFTSLQNNTLTVDTINGTIQFVTPTEANNSYLNRNNTLINITASDTNLANITIYLINSTFLILGSSSIP